jgi:hypothetical protein
MNTNRVLLKIAKSRREANPEGVDNTSFDWDICELAIKCHDDEEINVYIDKHISTTLTYASDICQPLAYYGNLKVLQRLVGLLDNTYDMRCYAWCGAWCGEQIKVINWLINDLNVLTHTPSLLDQALRIIFQTSGYKRHLPLFENLAQMYNHPIVWYYGFTSVCWGDCVEAVLFLLDKLPEEQIRRYTDSTFWITAVKNENVLCCLLDRIQLRQSQIDDFIMVYVRDGNTPLIRIFHERGLLKRMHKHVLTMRLLTALSCKHFEIMKILLEYDVNLLKEIHPKDCVELLNLGVKPLNLGVNGVNLYVKRNMYLKKLERFMLGKSDESKILDPDTFKHVFCPYVAYQDNYRDSFRENLRFYYELWVLPLLSILIENSPDVYGTVDLALAKPALDLSVVIHLIFALEPIIDKWFPPDIMAPHSIWNGTIGRRLCKAVIIILVCCSILFTVELYSFLLNLGYIHYLAIWHLLSYFGCKNVQIIVLAFFITWECFLFAINRYIVLPN